MLKHVTAFALERDLTVVTYSAHVRPIVVHAHVADEKHATMLNGAWIWAVD